MASPAHVESATARRKTVRVIDSLHAERRPAGAVLYPMQVEGTSQPRGGARAHGTPGSRASGAWPSRSMTNNGRVARAMGTIAPAEPPANKPSMPQPGVEHASGQIGRGLLGRSAGDPDRSVVQRSATIAASAGDPKAVTSGKIRLSASA